jgi:hypothetical protein
MRHYVYAVAVSAAMVSAMACRSAAPFDARNQSTRAPDPSGCYVRVFDAPDYRGSYEYINGPAKFDRLTSVPGGASWYKRIRSARLGPTANVAMWTGERFAGQRLILSEAAYPSLPAGFDRSITSMEIRCATASTPVAANSQPATETRN